ERVYTPEAASVAEMRSLHRALHVDRVVVVQPSVYGTDNGCTLDAVKQLGSRARAIAVIDERAPSSTLVALHARGVRGIRINLAVSGQANAVQARDRLRRSIEQIEGRHWHIQMFTGLAIVEAIRDRIAESPVPIVFDHFGGAQA